MARITQLHNVPEFFARIGVFTVDNSKERKVLPLSVLQKDDRGPRNDSEKTEAWEENYFNRLSTQPPRSSEGRNSGEEELLGDTQIVAEIMLHEVAVSPFQTREIAGDDELSELQSSISSKGIIQPVIVRELGMGGLGGKRYELVAGERRFRAAHLAGLSSVPAIIRDLTDQESLELAIIENAQRENLNAIEEARAYHLLSDRFDLSHADIAKTVGKNRATISNSLRLLQLEPEVIELLRSGELTAGHGRALLVIEDQAAQLKLARLAVQKALSVRALENLVSHLDEEFTDEEELEDKQRSEQSIRRMESKIGEYLGLERVRLRSDNTGKRSLTLNFDTEASWKRFMSRIKD